MMDITIGRSAEETPEEAQIRRAEKFMTDAMAVNLDEVTDEKVRVSIREYSEDPAQPGRRIGTWRQVELDSYVPMQVFNSMMAGRTKMLRMQKLREQMTDQGGEVNEDDPTTRWMTESVLKVWLLTETDMTYDRLDVGLNMAKVQSLFARFFSASLSLGTSKAAPVGSTTNAST